MKQLNIALQAQFNKMCATGKLFRSSLSGQDVWDLYMSGFGNDPVFRDPESSEHNCNQCKSFIRRYGNIVAVDEAAKIMTIFDVYGNHTPDTEEYKNSCWLISGRLRAAPIADVFFETYTELNALPYEACNKSMTEFKLGIPENHKRYTKEEAEKFGVVKADEIRTFNHMMVSVPAAFVDKSGKSVEAIRGEYRDAKNVFLRGMQEISLDTLLLVRDLIAQGSLLNGEAHLHKVIMFSMLKSKYDETDNKDNWAWATSHGLNIAKFRNELIGTLCAELSEGKELNEACQAWNKRVDPVNYMKASAPITKRQIEEAKKFIIDNGYEESFDRRFATMDDIKVSEILHYNVGDGKVKSVSILDGVKPTSTRHKRAEFDGVEEVGIEKFMADILPNCTGVEAFLGNGHAGNLVSLTTANVLNSKPIFKWDNNYSWTFNGNLAGKSQIKEAVKSLGGKVDGVLRFSIMWAEDSIDNSDLDAHCLEPNGFEIFYASKTSYHTGGNLDIDITTPQDHKVYRKTEVVENITYPSLSQMKEGTYSLFVRQFAARSSKGFKAEIEFDGELYAYHYDVPVWGDVAVATVTLKDGVFSISHKLPETAGAGKEIYGLETNQFHKVNLVCLSPNHWEGNKAGNKHYLFMLEGCKPPAAIRSFHNENLIPELLTHRKVTEVLANTTMIEPNDRQLSGLGFNATVRDELVVRLSGTHKRVVRIRF